MNLSQLSARIFIRTNPSVIPSEHCEAICSMLVKYLMSNDCHHELLQFEGIMALTNLSAAPNYKEKLVTLGAWTRAIEIISEVDLERSTIGQARIILASAELLSNLSLTPQVQERAANPNMRNLMITNLRIIYNTLIQVTIEDESGDNSTDALLQFKSQVKVAVIGLLANLVDHSELVKSVLDRQIKGAATLFMALMKEAGSTRQDDVWHRGLVLIDEVQLEIDDVPYATQVQGYRKIAALTQSNEVRNLAEKLAS